MIGEEADATIGVFRSDNAIFGLVDVLDSPELPERGERKVPVTKCATDFPNDDANDRICHGDTFPSAISRIAAIMAEYLLVRKFPAYKKGRRV